MGLGWVRALAVGSALLSGLAGCQGAGEGQVDGTLFLRGCPPLDPTEPGSRDVPSPLPAFSLDPQYFYGEVMLSLKQGLSAQDPRGVDRMRIRLQRDSGKPDRANSLELLIYDLDRFPQIQDAAIARGERGAPIVPPDLDTTTAPLPPDPGASVRGSLSLNATCWFPSVKPLLRGYVYFSSLGRNLGEEVAGELSVTIEDERAAREQGSPPPAPDAAGSLTGWFRFPLRSGSVVPGL
jgi:hypothetical protein